MMGSPANEPNRSNDENQVSVRLTRGFWLGQTEVTQGQWQTVLGTAPWKGDYFVIESATYPAVLVSHSGQSDSAENFCEALTEIERQAGRLPSGWVYRLPTEAEWEYACRAGESAAYGFGADESRLGAHGWFDKNAWNIGEKYAHQAGSKSPNAWGLKDMHGNVSEWCAAKYSSSLISSTDPQGGSSGALWVHRGGTWSLSAKHCRSACRDKLLWSRRESGLGFRVALCQDGQ